jgi:3-oxoacyl-[acyl-carrier protein] reductase
MTDEQWHRVMDVNVSGSFYLIRALAPDMVSRRSGAIVTISSMWGRSGASCEAAYSASKAAIIGLTQALAKELGPSGVRVNRIAPGVIDTKMMDEHSEETKAILADETPLGRLGTGEDVAKAAAFLLSDDACFITGQTLGVDGGYL